MTIFQFDQCLMTKRLSTPATRRAWLPLTVLRRSCAARKIRNCLRSSWHPPHPFVTLDRALPTEHTADIPDSNPGIIVVNYSRDVLRTITTGEASKILRKFKQQVTTWHQLSVRNSVIEITEKSIEVWHMESGKLIHDSFMEFKDDGLWIPQLLRLLEQNSQRPFFPKP